MLLRLQPVVMALTNWSQLVDSYYSAMSHKDPRLNDWLVETPWPTLGLTLFYFVFVTKLGPAFMRHKEPFNLKTLLIVYNFSMVLLSAYMTTELGASGWFTGYKFFGCQPVDYSWSPKGVRMINVMWWFWLSKLIELVDTVFFILRKKFSHVTFLHVVHHGFLPLSYWSGVRFAGGGFGTFHCMLNAFVHTVMYFYYGIAALGPKYQKYLWWKKSLTVLQMVQFVVVVFHCAQALLTKDCPYPSSLVYAIGAYSVFFLILFANYYRHAYLKAPKKPSKESDKGLSYQNGMVKNGYAKSQGENGHNHVD